jgi:hypothetical protein
MVSPQLKAHFESLGVPLIPLRIGATMLVDEVAGCAPDQIELVLGGEPKAEALNPQSEGRSFSVEVAVGKRTHPYLADHAIQGTPVVPITMVIEWFTRTAHAFGPELLLVRLLDLKVLRGISLSNFADRPEHFIVRARQLTNGSGATVSLELVDRKGNSLYRCTAELAPRGETPRPSNGDARDLALEDWGDQIVYDGKLLFHGPAFQMIRAIEGISDHGITAELSGVQTAGWTSDTVAADPAWSTDPLALDGGLQLALLWCKRVLGGNSLPTGIGEIRSWSDGPFSGPVRCTLTGRESQGRKSVSDLLFWDANSNVVAEFIGVETHLLPDQSQG